MDRVAVFIDGAYLDKVLEIAFDRTRINFADLVEALLFEDDNLLRVYYYHCPPYKGQDPTEQDETRFANKMRFFTALSNLPKFETKLGRLVFRGNSESGKPIFMQKLVDVMLAVDMVQLAATRQINRVILVAGDSDFTPVVEAVKNLGVSVTLYHGPPLGKGSGYNSLHESADEKIEIDQGMIDQAAR